MYNNGFAYGQQPQQASFAQPHQAHIPTPQYTGPPPPLPGYGSPFPQSNHAQQPQYPPQPSSIPQQSFVNPALAVATDPNAFAQMFKGHLAALTFNSKPIITNLTVIAHEHSARMSAVVAQCLDEHVLSCPPPHRLPAFYVVDSICKNVGPPYTTLWADRIVPMFMETYRIVDHGIKVRMEELLSTWRTTGPGGHPLFGESAQYSIERSLFGSQGPAPQPQAAPPHMSVGIQSTGTPQHHDQPPALYSSHFANSQVGAVIERFDRLLATSQHNQHYNAAVYDATRHEALSKLRALVASAQLSASEITQIEAQLAALEGEMLGQGLSSPGQSRSPRQTDTASAQHRQYPTPPVVSAMRSPRSNTPIALPANLAGVLASIGKLSSGVATPPSALRSPLPGNAAQHQMAKVNSSHPLDLIANLRKAGLLPSTAATPERAIEADSNYCQLIKGMSLKLTVSDLMREPPLGSLDAVVAQELPLQCRQCANRYPSGSQGQASLDKHLDWHFRQNRRAKDSIVRGQSRSWLSRLDEWVRGGHDDTAPLKRAGEGDGDNGNGVSGIGSALTPQQEAELKAASKSFVLAPTDDPEASARPCPVCKEIFKSEWSEDEEDFVWKNCVRVDDVYYHGSCHFSAKTLRNTVTSRVAKAAARGATDSRGGSRDSTPQLDLQSLQVPAAPVPSTKSADEMAPVLSAVKEEETDTAQNADQRGHDAVSGNPALGGVKRERDDEVPTLVVHETSADGVTGTSTANDGDEQSRMHKVARTGE